MDTINKVTGHDMVKIIEPIKHFIKEFNTPEEFNMWYKMNKEDMDELTTHKLNKMYHITGYRITKIKGELMLRKYDESKKITRSIDILTGEETNESRVEEIERNIERINEEIKAIKTAVQSIKDYLT